MKRNPWLIAALCFIVVVVLILASAKWILPGYLKSKITDGIRAGCPECAIHIRSLDVALSHPGRLIFHDVKFAGGQGGHSLVEVRFETMTADLSLSQTRSQDFVFDDVNVEGLEVIYADGDAPKKKSERESEGSTKVGVLHAQFERGLFRYAHTKNKQTSILHFRNLSGEIKNAGNTPALARVVAEAHVSGQIEKSGHGELTIAAFLRPGPWHVDVDVRLEDQNLEDLNTFFTPNDGVILSGRMLEAHAHTTTRDELTKARVEARYKDANFKQSPTASKGSFEAALTTIGASLLMNKDNSDFPADARKAEVDVKRDPNEALVHFLLRSAKLGLLEVVKTKKP